MTHVFDIFQERRLSVGKIDNNKQMKRESLLDSAFSLFIDNGFNKTSISDIVNNAGVAKGTFYLYFKDKYDIRNHLIAHKASQIFQAAYADLLRHPDIQDFEEQVLFITDNILDQFAANHSLVTLISKHLSWGFFKNSLTFSPFSDAPAIYTIYESLLSHAAYTYRSPELMFYMILELVSGTSYNAILYQQPIPLEDLKPELYDAIRGIFKQFRIRKKRNVTESTEKTISSAQQPDHPAPLRQRNKKILSRNLPTKETTKVFFVFFMIPAFPDIRQSAAPSPGRATQRSRPSSDGSDPGDTVSVFPAKCC